MSQRTSLSLTYQIIQFKLAYIKHIIKMIVSQSLTITLLTSEEACALPPLLFLFLASLYHLHCTVLEIPQIKRARFYSSASACLKVNKGALTCLAFQLVFLREFVSLLIHYKLLKIYALYLFVISCLCSLVPFVFQCFLVFA